MRRLKITPFSVFLIFIYVFMALLALLCLIPIINILAISLSSQSEVSKGTVFFLPREFSLDSYSIVLRQMDFLKSFIVSILRVAAGTFLNVTVTLLMAYPLSKTNHDLPGRTAVICIVVFVMLFNGGLVPTYLLIKDLGLLNNYLVLILPGLVPVFNVVLMMNFIRMLPASLEEAALIDGAGFCRILTQIIVPTSTPVIATVSLFSAVGHWNDYFTGLIYLNIKQYPLQTYLFSMSVNRDINNLEQALLLRNVNDRTLLAAQMFIALIPVLIAYPFVQKYFVKGIVLGSVKG